MGTHIHQNIIAINADAIGIHFHCWIKIVLARAAVELPEVERTHQPALVDLALAQRTAVVRANAVEGVDGASHVAHRIRVVGCDDFHDRAGRKRGKRARVDERHASSKPVWGGTCQGCGPARQPAASVP